MPSPGIQLKPVELRDDGSHHFENPIDQFSHGFGFQTNLTGQWIIFYQDTCYNFPNWNIASNGHSFWFIFYDKFITIICIFFPQWLWHQVMLLVKQV